VTPAGRFTRQHRKAGYVVKTLAPTLATDERLARAMLSRGRSGVDHYLSCLAAAGVRLPDELSVLDTGESGAAVRHRWADGGLLADSVTDDSHGARTFVEAVETIAGWVIRLDGTDARLDTNLANFCLHQDSVVALDVLPPLIPSLRPDPRDLYERLLFGLCFDSATTLAALVGYGAVRLLGHPDLEARRRFADLAGTVWPIGHRVLAEPFPSWWFHARAVLGLRGVEGRVGAELVKRLFADTSMRGFQRLDERRRAARVRHVHDVVRSGALR